MAHPANPSYQSTNPNNVELTTILESEESEISRVSIPVNEVAQNNLIEFVPRHISNWSCNCAKDVLVTICSTGLSVVFGYVSSEVSNTAEKVGAAVMSSCFGLAALTITAYGISIRRCPSSQRFWHRS